VDPWLRVVPDTNSASRSKKAPPYKKRKNGVDREGKVEGREIIEFLQSPCRFYSY